MRGKLLFVAGIGVGYLASTERGRRLTAQARAAIVDFAQSPTGQRAADTLKEYAGDMIPVLRPFLKPSRSASGGSPRPTTVRSTPPTPSSTGSTSGSTTDPEDTP